LKQRSHRPRSSPEPEKPTEGRNLVGPTGNGLNLGDGHNSRRRRPLPPRPSLKDAVPSADGGAHPKLGRTLTPRPKVNETKQVHHCHAPPWGAAPLSGDGRHRRRSCRESNEEGREMMLEEALKAKPPWLTRNSWPSPPLHYCWTGSPSLTPATAHGRESDKNA
jgi:hypothetical protein